MLETDTQADVDHIRWAMNDRTAVPLEMLTEETLKKAGCWDHVAVLPNGINDRFRYLGNMLVQMIRSTKTDDNMRFAVGALTQSLSYLLNSCSWEDGTLHDFDREEIRRKLRPLTRPQKGGDARWSRQ